MVNDGPPVDSVAQDECCGHLTVTVVGSRASFGFLSSGREGLLSDECPDYDVPRRSNLITLAEPSHRSVYTPSPSA